MDYKQKYEEVFEQAKQAIENIPDKSLVSWLENIFPELHESEDEKIRKAIVKIISDIDGGYPFEKYGIIKKKALVWLEKQGEQKSIDKIEPKFMPGECIRYRGENYKIKDIEKTKNGFIYNVSIIGKPYDPEEIKTAIGMAAEKDMVKIEQPSTNWSEEDEKIIKRIDSLLYSQCTIHGSEYEDIHNWLKSLKPQNRWKASKEQMDALNAINLYGEISYVGQRGLLIKLYQDLKRLKLC